MEFTRGDYMRRARRWAGLTQEALAKLAKVSKGTVVLLENNKVSTSIETIVALADALGISIDEYIGHKPTKPQITDNLKRYYAE